MNPYPGFTVRSYPAFRAARLYRVFVAPGALYFIRTKGLISASDAGAGLHIDPGQAAVAALIRWFGRKSLEAARAEVEQSDPETMVQSSKKYFKIAVENVSRSSLEPPSFSAATATTTRPGRSSRERSRSPFRSRIPRASRRRSTISPACSRPGSP